MTLDVPNDTDPLFAGMAIIVWGLLMVGWADISMDNAAVGAIGGATWTLAIGAVYYGATADGPLVPARPPCRRGVVHVGPAIAHLVAHSFSGVVALSAVVVGCHVVAVRRAWRWLVVPKAANGGDGS